MSKLLSHKFFKEYSQPEWIVLKVCLGIMWILIIGTASINPEKIFYPSGLCSLINCSPLLNGHLLWAFRISALLLSLLYFAEKQMAITTLLMFLLSLFCFTLEESNGILNRSGLYTMIFLAQSIAYFRNREDLKIERVQFAVQIIAAGYMLAGISKLRETGLGWVVESPQASLQILKGYSAYYFNSGDITQLEKGMKFVNFALHHALFVKTLFSISLLLELFAWLSVKNKTRAFIYGVMLTAMHLGIFYFMHIIIVAVFIPMLLFMVNPVYPLWLFLKKAKVSLGS